MDPAVKQWLENMKAGVAAVQSADGVNVNASEFTPNADEVIVLLAIRSDKQTAQALIDHLSETESE